MTIPEYEDLVISTAKPKFKFGDKVATRQTGFPGIGEVLCQTPAILYLNLAGIGTIKYWDRLYPDWKDKNIYLVHYDEPRRVVTYEEYLTSLVPDASEIYKESYLRKVYEEEVIVRHTMYYPEEDLELFE